MSKQIVAPKNGLSWNTHKKIPPKAANAHMRYALKVTGASTRAVSVVADSTAPPGIMAVGYQVASD